MGQTNQGQNCHSTSLQENLGKGPKEKFFRHFTSSTLIHSPEEPSMTYI